jgi:hypothetical protein
MSNKGKDVPRDIAPRYEITLGEEEICDVSLATFYVFEKENAGTPRRGKLLARGYNRGCSTP